jgi:hypothetical protein
MSEKGIIAKIGTAAPTVKNGGLDTGEGWQFHITSGVIALELTDGQYKMAGYTVEELQEIHAAHQKTITPEPPEVS